MSERIQAQRFCQCSVSLCVDDVRTMSSLKLANGGKSSSTPPSGEKLEWRLCGVRRERPVEGRYSVSRTRREGKVERTFGMQDAGAPLRRSVVKSGRVERTNRSTVGGTPAHL